NVAGGPFRAVDFDAPMRLEVPPLGSPVRYDLVDARGRSVGRGSGALNDLGTLAGTFRLEPEAALGDYALRGEGGGLPRVVSTLSPVRASRRPTCARGGRGVPARTTSPRSLELQREGRYYFGTPVAGGAVVARLCRPDGESVASARGELNTA